MRHFVTLPLLSGWAALLLLVIGCNPPGPSAMYIPTAMGMTETPLPLAHTQAGSAATPVMATALVGAATEVLPVTATPTAAVARQTPPANAGQHRTGATLPATSTAEFWTGPTLPALPTEVPEPSQQPEESLLPQGASTTATLPPAVDLTLRMPPIDPVGQEKGDCVTWAVGYYYKSYQEMVEHNWSYKSLQHLFSPSFIYNRYKEYAESQPSVEWAFWTLVSDGIAPLALFPYTGQMSNTQPDLFSRRVALNYRAASYEKLCGPCREADLDKLKHHLATQDPFVLAFCIYLPGPSDAFRWFPLDAYVPTVIESHKGPMWPYFHAVGHAVAVVGYDESKKRFKFANSWGTDWGDPEWPGYGYITYDAITGCPSQAWAMVNLPKPCPMQIQGDLNCDGLIDERDVDVVLRQWCTETDGRCQGRSADLNLDGLVNDSDMSVLLRNWAP